MHPVLIELGPVTLYTYGLAMAVAFLIGVQVSARRAPRFGFTAEQMHDSAIPVIAAGLLGGKLVYLFTNRDEVIRDWRTLLTLIRGGFVFYGGVIGGATGALLWARRHRQSFLAYADMVSPGLAFSLAIGRLGCFLNGCCYGTSVAWGLVFPGLGDGLTRHPTQLYELVGATLVGAWLLRVPAPPAGRQGRPGSIGPRMPGQVWGCFLVAYAALRFAIELLRDDPRGPSPAGLSVSQWLSIAGAVLGAALLFRKGER